MGGLMLIGCALIAFLIFSKHTTAGWTVAAVTVACAGIGFADDYLEQHHRRSLGLSGRVKMLLLALVAVALGLVVHNQHLGTDVYVPLIDVHITMGRFYYVFLFLVVAGATNAVNLTDGLDGLAAGTTTIALASYSAIMLVAYLVTQSPASHGLRPPGDTSSLDLAIISAALVGGAIGFLWYNAYPADVFMGDTGSFGLGGALAAMAVFTKTEFLLVVIGGIFVIEALSVLIQVIALQDHRQARVPDGPDPPPLRDDGVDREQDHRAVLDRRRDLRRIGLRSLLPLLQLVPMTGRYVVRGAAAARGWRPARRSRASGPDRWCWRPTDRTRSTGEGLPPPAPNGSSGVMQCRSGWGERGREESGGARVGADRCCGSEAGVRCGARWSWRRGCCPNPIVGHHRHQRQDHHRSLRLCWPPARSFPACCRLHRGLHRPDCFAISRPPGTVSPA